MVLYLWKFRLVTQNTSACDAICRRFVSTVTAVRTGSCNLQGSDDFSGRHSCCLRLAFCQPLPYLPSIKRSRSSVDTLTGRRASLSIRHLFLLFDRAFCSEVRGPSDTVQILSESSPRRDMQRAIMVLLITFISPKLSDCQEVDNKPNSLTNKVRGACILIRSDQPKHNLKAPPSSDKLATPPAGVVPLPSSCCLALEFAMR